MGVRLERGKSLPGVGTGVPGPDSPWLAEAVDRGVQVQPEERTERFRRITEGGRSPIWSRDFSQSGGSFPAVCCGLDHSAASRKSPEHPPWRGLSAGQRPAPRSALEAPAGFWRIPEASANSRAADNGPPPPARWEREAGGCAGGYSDSVPGACATAGGPAASPARRPAGPAEKTEACPTERWQGPPPDGSATCGGRRLRNDQMVAQCGKPQLSASVSGPCSTPGGVSLRLAAGCPAGLWPSRKPMPA